MLVNSEKSGYIGEGCGDDWAHRSSVIRNNHTQTVVGDIL